MSKDSQQVAGLQFHEIHLQIDIGSTWFFTLKMLIFICRNNAG